MPKGTITTWDNCCSIFMTKFFPPAKTMQLRSNITGFRQEDREPLALAWERMKDVVRNCPNHGMEEWLVLHLFYNALNPMSKSMLDIAAGGTFMGKDIALTTKLLNDMQDNHSQWHVERSSSKKVNSITEANNEVLTAKVDELICMIKDNEGNAISNSQIEEIDFIARNSNYPAWTNKNYNGFQKPYPSNAGVPNTYAGSNNNNANGNRQSLEDSLKNFIQAQSEQNSLIVKMTENHDVALGQLTK